MPSNTVHPSPNNLPAPRLRGLRVLSFVHDEFEDMELWYPIYRLREEGATVVLAGEKASHEYTGKYGLPAKSDIDYQQALATHATPGKDWHVVLVPGGWAPDKIRRFATVLELVKTADAQKRVIGQICHAGWVLISAKILDGRKVTSTPGIRDDMENAGAIWFDQPVVVDGHLVSSRRPPDLPDYARELIAAAEKLQR